MEFRTRHDFLVAMEMGLGRPLTKEDFILLIESRVRAIRPFLKRFTLGTFSNRISAYPDPGIINSLKKFAQKGARQKAVMERQGIFGLIRPNNGEDNQTLRYWCLSRSGEWYRFEVRIEGGVSGETSLLDVGYREVALEEIGEDDVLINIFFSLVSLVEHWLDRRERDHKEAIQLAFKVTDFNFALLEVRAKTE